MFGVTMANISSTGNTLTEPLRLVLLSTLAFVMCVTFKRHESRLSDHYGLYLQRSGDSVAVGFGD